MGGAGGGGEAYTEKVNQQTDQKKKNQDFYEPYLHTRFSLSQPLLPALQCLGNCSPPPSPPKIYWQLSSKAMMYQNYLLHVKTIN